MKKPKIIPRIEKLFPGENPRKKLLSLCEEESQRSVAKMLGVSEVAIHNMIKRIKKNIAIYS